MTRWEYAILSNPQSGTDSVGFSRVQEAGIVAEFDRRLGKGLKAGQSHAGFLHLNLRYVSSVVVAGHLGDLGWELVSHAVLTGGHEYWTFKRQVAE